MNHRSSRDDGCEVPGAELGERDADVGRPGERDRCGGAQVEAADRAGALGPLLVVAVNEWPREPVRGAGE